MAVDSSKARTTELTQQLREAAKLQDPAAVATVRLVKHLYEDVKERLVDAVGDDMLRLQGAARHLAKLHTELTVTPASIAPKE